LVGGSAERWEREDSDRWEGGRREKVQQRSVEATSFPEAVLALQMAPGGFYPSLPAFQEARKAVWLRVDLLSIENSVQRKH
jgi:hypothetical protein